MGNRPEMKYRTKELVSDIPESVNWAQVGAVTPVKNQGNCSSCWSFSATGAMEGRYFIKNNKLVSLSEQQLVDCSDCMGCAGGVMDLAFSYAEDHAIDTEDQYPYKAETGTCNVPTAGVAKVTKYIDVPAKSPLALA
jgi:C1A family cysteine protease